MLQKATVAVFLFFALTFSRAADPGAPVISVDGQVVTSSPVVRGDRATISLSTSFSGGSIFYTLDGTTPSGASTRYTEPFTITSTRILRAIAYSLDFSQTAFSGPIEIQIAPTFLLTANSPGGGGVSLSPTASGNRYLSETVVQLTAQPQANWKFLYWTGDATGAVNPLSLTITQNTTIKAVFGGKVSLLGAANGRVQMSPFFEADDIPYGDTVRITPLPDPGYYLASWGGSASGAANPFIFQMTAPTKTFSALFLPLPEGKAALSVYTDGKGGTVRVDRRMTYRDGISSFAPLPPANLYEPGEMVVVIAEPNPGYAFNGWSIGASGDQNPLPVKLEGSKVIRAFFAEGASINFSLSGGTVAKTPNLGRYPIGSEVTLQANPLEGYTFDSFFIGNTRITENPATIVVSSNMHIIGRFNGTARPPLWQHTFSGSYYGVIAADDSANSYLGEGRKMVALDSAGGARWSVDMPFDSELGQNVEARDLGIDPTGKINVLAGRLGRDTLHAFIRYQSAGAFVNSKSLGTSSTVGNMSIGTDASSYVVVENVGLGYYQPEIRTILPDNNYGPGNIIAISTPGSTRAELPSRPALGLDQRRFFTAGGYYSNVVYCSDSSANILWKNEIDGAKSLPVVLGLNRVYAVGGTGRLWAFGLDGSLQWTTVSAEPLQPPTIGADGTLYIGATNSARFYAFNPDGTVKWVRTPGSGNYKPPAIGADGTIYLADADSLYALNSNGDRLWQYRGAGSAPIISSNIVFVSGTNLVALPATGSGPANSPWPMIDASPQQTAAARPVIIVDPPPVMFDLPNSFMAADGFHLNVKANIGANVTLFSSEDLQTWTPFETKVATNGEVTFVQTNPPPAQFYRARVQ